MTHASRDTTTGLLFEERVKIQERGINVTKHKLYRYLKTKGVDYTTLISKKLLPDEAFVDVENSRLVIYEKNFSRPPVLLMKSLRLVPLKYGSIEKLPLLLASKMYLIPISLMSGSRNLNTKICLNILKA